MATEIKMPQLSDTMDSGKILSWNKKEGDEISRGDILAEVETDKANLEIESFYEGTLLKILVPADDTADVGSVIAVIGAPGEDVSGLGEGSASRESSSVELNAEQTDKKQEQPDLHATQDESPAPVQNQQTSSTNGRIIASPLARKIAQEKNIDLSSVHGSGPRGRIVRRDLDSAHTRGDARSATLKAPSDSAPEQPQVPPAGASPRVEPGSLTALSKMRETIASRMQQSVLESPHFYSTVSIDMEQALTMRAALKSESGYESLGVNDLIVKAAAYALSREPRVNAAMREGKLYQPPAVSIGIITALDDGLIIPVIHHADTLSLLELSAEARAAIERARSGRPSSKDLTGGTFSISNMGMFGVENFTAIINPGQGAVLAVSAVQNIPVVRDGQVVPGRIMKVTLSVDHRIIDGVMAATFLKHFKHALEVPALLMV